jgi:hypothetical protein
LQNCWSGNPILCLLKDRFAGFGIYERIALQAPANRSGGNVQVFGNIADRNFLVLLHVFLKNTNKIELRRGRKDVLDCKSTICI